MQGIAVLPDRLASKIMPVMDGCWLWTASLDRRGYGQYRVGKRMVGAHRVTYEAAGGDIPDGLVIDHLCRVPSCVNPAHLEPVTQQENVLRGEIGQRTHCKEGHSLKDAYIWNAPSGGKHRRCRQCTKRWAREAYHRNKE